MIQKIFLTKPSHPIRKIRTTKITEKHSQTFQAMTYFPQKIFKFPFLHQREVNCLIEKGLLENLKIILGKKRMSPCRKFGTSSKKVNSIQFRSQKFFSTKIKDKINHLYKIQMELIDEKFQILKKNAKKHKNILLSMAETKISFIK